MTASFRGRILEVISKTETDGTVSTYHLKGGRAALYKAQFDDKRQQWRLVYLSPRGNTPSYFDKKDVEFYEI